MKLTVPSVGRIVHFVLVGNGEHRPAIVVRSHPDGNIDLCVFMPEMLCPSPQAGVYFCVKPMPVFVEEKPSVWKRIDPGPPGHTWHWPEREPEVEIDIPVETEKEE